jgi:hypothetical protein
LSYENGQYFRDLINQVAGFSTAKSWELETKSDKVERSSRDALVLELLDMAERDIAERGTDDQFKSIIHWRLKEIRAEIWKQIK